MYNPNFDMLRHDAASMNMFSTNENVMYIMQPRSFGNQCIRPIRYHIDDRHISRVADTIHAGAGVLHGNKSAGLNTLSDLIAGEVVMPSESAVVMRAGHINEMHSFILIINNERSRVPIHSNLITTTSMNVPSILGMNRAFYFGYIIGDPYTYNGANPVLNMNAAIQITHKTLLTKTPMIGNGGYSDAPNVTANVDVVPTGLTTNLASDPNLVENTPFSISSMASVNESNCSVLSPNAFSIKARSRPLTIGSNIITPSGNLKTIFNGVYNSIQSAQMDSSRYNSGYMADITDTTSSSFDRLTTSLQNVDPMNHMGLNEGEVTTFAHINDRYNPKVVVINFNRSNYYDCQDQELNTNRSILSSFLMQVMPAVFGDFGIVDVSFQYDSSVLDAVNPLIVGGAWNQHPSILANNFQLALLEIKRTVFDGIVKTCGHFHIDVHIGIGTISRCVLNFYDWNEVVREPFEVPTIFGGMLSSALADNSLVAHNALQLAELYDNVVTPVTGQKTITNNAPYDNGNQYVDYSNYNPNITPGYTHQLPNPQYPAENNGLPSPNTGSGIVYSR